MPNPTETLSPLIILFEDAMRRLIEGRTRRWRATLEGRRPRSRRGKISPLLRRFKRGEITLDQFLRAKVERALQPLTHLLDESDIAFLREWGRERLEDDPVLTELVAYLASFAPEARLHHAHPTNQEKPEMTNNLSDDEREKLNSQREAADVLRAALIGYIEATNDKPPELLTAIEFLGTEVRRLDAILNAKPAT